MLTSILAVHANFSNLPDVSEKKSQQGLSLAQTLGMPIVEARCLTVLGDFEIYYGRYVEARAYLEEANAIYAVLDKTYESQFTRLRLGYLYQNMGEYDLARQHYQHLIYTSNKRNTDELAALALEHLGYLEISLDHFSAGLQYSVEALEIFERFDSLLGIFSASRGIAIAYCGLGQLNEARYYFHIALTTYVHHGSQMNLLAMQTLAGIAKLLAMEGDVARSVELTSFIQQHPHASDETKTIVRTLSDELEAEIQSVVFQSAKERGAYLELESLAIGFIEEFSTDDVHDPPPAEALGDHELELLQQVTDGLASGELFDENLSEREQESVRILVDTVDALLEKEKAKIMATFMESASHDLRTPLTIINTSLYLLERISDPDKQKGRLKLIKEQVAHLQTLIENLISMARLDGGTNLDMQPLDLNQLVIVIQQSQIVALAVERGFDIHVVLLDEPLMVNADIGDLQQAFFNIIENAVNYTPDGGIIKVELRSESHGAILEVSDTGMGIEEDDLPHIFERFYRADKARTERGRADLGLTIARKIIEAHQGHIDVVSTSDNGSMFRVVLPHIPSAKTAN